MQQWKQRTPPKEPVIGRHHILEAFRSIMRVTTDFNINVTCHEEKEIDGIILSNATLISIILLLGTRL